MTSWFGKAAFLRQATSGSQTLVILGEACLGINEDNHRDGVTSLESTFFMSADEWPHKITYIER